MPYAYPTDPPDPADQDHLGAEHDAAIDGNNAQVRVIVDGSASSGGTGFTLDTAHSMSAD